MFPLATALSFGDGTFLWRRHFPLATALTLSPALPFLSSRAKPRDLQCLFPQTNLSSAPAHSFGDSTFLWRRLFPSATALTLSPALPCLSSRAKPRDLRFLFPQTNLSSATAHSFGDGTDPVIVLPFCHPDILLLLRVFCISPNKPVILSEALRRSIANRELSGAESKDPGDVHLTRAVRAFSTTEAQIQDPPAVPSHRPGCWYMPAEHPPAIAECWQCLFLAPGKDRGGSAKSGLRVVAAKALFANPQAWRNYRPRRG
jgi:hypothetical protein